MLAPVARPVTFLFVVSTLRCEVVVKNFRVHAHVDTSSCIIDDTRKHAVLVC